MIQRQSRAKRGAIRVEMVSGRQPPVADVAGGGSNVAKAGTSRSSLQRSVSDVPLATTEARGWSLVAESQQGQSQSPRLAQLVPRQASGELVGDWLGGWLGGWQWGQATTASATPSAAHWQGGRATNPANTTPKAAAQVRHHFNRTGWAENMASH